MNNDKNSTKFLMSIDNMTPKELSSIISLSDNTILGIVNGTSNPTIETFRSVADYYDMPFDIMLGRNIDRYQIKDINGELVLTYKDPVNQKRLQMLMLYHQLPRL